ncbi:MAG: hypothetical protein IJQ83_05725 [Bacteroidales bacterium]|nr:hypothetical protein [Bacteroidales bacterium]
MAKTVDILEIERKRSDTADFATIHLFVEGTFYRAYEWSAWLCCRYINEFKPTKRELKSEVGETIVYVGFPITSLSRHVPENAKPLFREDKNVDIVLDMAVLSGEDAGKLKLDFVNWKNSVPMTVPKKSSVVEDLASGAGGQPHRMSEILFKVLSFPVEQKSPMECMQFITGLKQEITTLL